MLITKSLSLEVHICTWRWPWEHFRDNQWAGKEIQESYGWRIVKIQVFSQGFSNEVVYSIQNRSGKHDELMMQIWGGSPATKPLPSTRGQFLQAGNYNLLVRVLESVQESLGTSESSSDNSDQELTHGSERRDLGSGIGFKRIYCSKSSTSIKPRSHTYRWQTNMKWRDSLLHSGNNCLSKMKKSLKDIYVDQGRITKNSEFLQQWVAPT